MAALVIKSFGGISPKLNPRYLPDNGSQVAINCPVFAGSLQSLPGLSTPVHTLPHGFVPKSIYKYGQDAVADNVYWMANAAPMDIVRSQIAGDAQEWIFCFSDASAPAATFNSIALGTSAAPTQAFPLAMRPVGVPNPIVAPSVAAGALPALSGDTNKVLITPTLLSQITSAFGVNYKINDGGYVSVSLSGTSADVVAAALNAEALLTAVVEGGSVSVTTSASTDTLTLQWKTGGQADTSSAFTYDTFDKSGSGGPATKPFIVITDAELVAMVGKRVTIKTNDAVLVDNFVVTSQFTAEALTAAMTPVLGANWMANWGGNQVGIFASAVGGGVGSYIEYSRTGKGDTLAKLVSASLRIEQDALIAWGVSGATFQSNKKTITLPRGSPADFLSAINNNFAGDWKGWLNTDGSTLFICSSSEDKSVADYFEIRYKVVASGSGEVDLVTNIVRTTRPPVTLATDNSVFLTIPAAEVSALAGCDLYARSDAQVFLTSQLMPSTVTATGLALALNTAFVGKWVASVVGGDVEIKAGSATITPTSFIAVERTNAGIAAVVLRSDYSATPSAAQIFLTNTDLDALKGKHLVVNVNTEQPAFYPVAADASVNFSDVKKIGITPTFYGNTGPVVLLRGPTTGSSATLRLRSGTYAVQKDVLVTIGPAIEPNYGVMETRVYAWTWVSQQGDSASTSGFTFESAPSLPSGSIDLYPKQEAVLTNLPTTLTGYDVDFKRIYRSVNGTYLFVDEIPASATSFTDSKTADELGEEMPSLAWAAPDPSLRGAIGLPNGLIAAFTGRDVHFCEPYHPHAWPIEYSQTVEYPIVGLGRMDTTLAVLTTGTPYFIQGSHPDNMVMVKSDIEQSCVSKRSIVSAGGSVLYASPDGLIMLSSSGAKILTDALMTQQQWRAYRPETMHAYLHDSKYIAFGDAGGLIFDLMSGQVITHDITASCGFADLRSDTLFLSDAAGNIRKWMHGTPTEYTWRSKKFTMPTVVGFSCAVVAAETYPMKFRVYVDGALALDHVVTSRQVFRLPSVKGRDWEMEMVGNAEVFAVGIAQSPQELANV